MWTNLGVVYSRSGYPDYAESAFLTALSYGRDNLLAVNNLAHLYEQQGKAELAAYYDQQADAFRRRNPFYLYARARQHYADGEYPEARDALRRAVRIQPTEHEFYQLLGLTELAMGDARPGAEGFRTGARVRQRAGRKGSLQPQAQPAGGKQSGVTEAASLAIPFIPDRHG